MESQDMEIVAGLSEPAKKLYYSLDRNSRKRLLEKAKEYAQRHMRIEKEKERVFRKKQVKVYAKNDGIKRGSEIGPEINTKIESVKKNEGAAKAPSSVSKTDVSLVEAASVSLGILLTGQQETEKSYGDKKERDKSFYHMVPKNEAKTVSKKVQESYRKKMQKKEVEKSARRAKKAYEEATKGVIEAIKAISKVISEMMANIAESMAANPVVWIVLIVIILLIIIVGVVATIVGGAGAAGGSYDYVVESTFSEEVEAHRETVAEYCEEYDISEYENLILAIIQQESGGKGKDVMQSSASGYCKSSTVKNAKESIDYGVHTFADCLKKAGCKNANDLKRIKLALQGYNYGSAYIDWALKNYKGYTYESAKEYSGMMKEKLKVKVYGDPDYVPHVLKYYLRSGDSVANESAQKILTELRENNKASPAAWKVIAKGASLVGTVTYSMEKRQGTGVDKPEYLDCSSFTAWSFHKVGYSQVPYYATTTTFIQSADFEDIDAKSLRPGDIGLKNKSISGGGTNHVGIYCGTLKNGTKVLR